MEHQVINIDNYTVVQKNRPIVNVNAKKGSGGVAIAINNRVLSDFRIECVDNDTDGLLGVKLVATEDDFKIGILANYLSPDNYHYGQDPEGYFSHATSLWEDLRWI